MSRSKALDRALQTTWKVLQDEQTGLSATIEQKVGSKRPSVIRLDLKHLHLTVCLLSGQICACQVYRRNIQDLA